MRVGSVFVCLLLLPFASPIAGEDEARPKTLVVETDPMPLDALYPSMTGPYQRVPVGSADVDWITGFRTQVIDADSDEEMGGEFFCHSQIQVGSGLRLVVEATGTQEVRFPPGFGVPARHIVASTGRKPLPMNVLGMLLNNHHPDIDRRVRIRAEIDYLRDEDLGERRLLPLYPIHMTMTVDDHAAYTALQSHPEGEEEEMHCSLVKDESSHWWVPPGRQVTRLRAPLEVPVPGRVHFIATHVHNHGEMVRLTDTTTSEVLWQADVVHDPVRRQITHIPVYSSAEGFPVYPGREYELTAVYENTTDRDVDAMAAMYMFFQPEGGKPLFFPGADRAPAGG